MINLNNYKPIDFPWDYTCFSSTDKNPISLQLPLYHIDEHLYTKFKCLPNHVGWENVIHGGVIALICDDILGKHVLMITKSFCVTRNLNVKYLKPMYSKYFYIFKTTIIRKSKTTVWIKVDIYDEKNSLCAYADADFAIISEEDAKNKNITSYSINELTSKT
ncbi:PaaI family thioesterase [Francisella adeliensis]|uniref:Thioesterase n=1 Tax=Francisella adeliensis TaxID=2007306 RepID=A0A2Z4XWW4_9GAMM|nr:PaaI family thioesterase [Francisella adeliensis]AXA33371.1 thioesterase [Francisella adeliensis]MBK2085386.1 PaaI family thioesterase [Francisella adeliensis]MBK2097116.1 PaaI family thioesterase [Francisella adeliensis]QIW11599.1 PaaI family thioesterase [Francisella adeliensis]QIW13474.1 PaaI family thioesterase [Francisella adeliensis]